MTFQSLKSSENNFNRFKKFKNLICKYVKCDLGFKRSKIVFGIRSPNIEDDFNFIRINYLLTN